MTLVLVLLTTATAWADGDFVDNGNGSYTIMTPYGWTVCWLDGTIDIAPEHLYELGVAA